MFLTSTSFPQLFQGNLPFSVAKCESFRCVESRRKESVEKSLTAYKNASNVAISELRPTNPIRLRLALNLSVFYYEVLDSRKNAICVAQQALHEARTGLDELSQEDSNDSKHVIELLHENLARWRLDGRERPEDEQNDGENFNTIQDAPGEIDNVQPGDQIQERQPPGRSGHVEHDDQPLDTFNQPFAVIQEDIPSGIVDLDPDVKTDGDRPSLVHDDQPDVNQPSPIHQQQFPQTDSDGITSVLDNTITGVGTSLSYDGIVAVPETGLEDVKSSLAGSLRRDGVANAGQQLQTVTEHPATVTTRGPLQVSEEPAMVNVEDIEPDDIVIAVMGPQSSGKSTFVRLASGYDIQGGFQLGSYTTDVCAIRFLDQESGRHVVLVDTPGLNDTFKSDLEILNMTACWLISSYKMGNLLSGVMYLHPITANRMAGLLKDLLTFQKLCGKDAMDNVYLTTTMWDKIEPSIGERRLEELVTEYWNSMIIRGARVIRCRSDDDSAKRTIRQIVRREAARKALLLQQEIVDLHKELRETQAGQELRGTQAGQELYDNLGSLVERRVALLKRIDRERKGASDASMLEGLEKECNELREQIDDKLRQMKEPRWSWLEFLPRFFSRR
ncbi:14-3-3 protein-domain-containing protein [Boletus reticuloceps]|uniref:14-3-3 protein-domain-containing protein n=1 Tax=Boletus reticuloceps TaxID=495285 RepID=A0A8I2YPK8_9AGAM|nr:14-3-3 protein-domain-containing protein [Boletus reticuloceps]